MRRANPSFSGFARALLQPRDIQEFVYAIFPIWILESACLAKTSGTDATETVHAAPRRRRLVDAVVVGTVREMGRTSDRRVRPDLCARERVCFRFNGQPNRMETRYVAAGSICEHSFFLRVWISIWPGEVLEPLVRLDAPQRGEGCE